MSSKEVRVFTSDELYLCRKMVDFDLVDETEAKGVITSTVRTGVYDRLAQILADDHLIERLTRILPKNEELNSRYRFLVDKNAINILERFAEEQFWAEYSEEDFLALKSQMVCTAPAVTIGGFISLWEDPKASAWFGSKANLARFINESESMAMVGMLARAENIDEIITTFDFAEFLDLQKIFKSMDLIAHPRVCKRLSELVIDPDDWATNIYELNMLLYDLDLVGFDTRELKKIMFGEYKKSLALRVARSGQLSGDENSRLADEVTMLRRSSENFGNKMRFEGAVKAGFKDDGRLPGAQKLVPRVTRDEWSEKWSRRLVGLDVEWLESKNNPVRNVMPLLGFEIEFEKVEDFDMSSYTLAENVGFKKGVGSSGSVLELSPGPFAHHRTAGLTFLSYIDSGMIDVDRYFDQSVHLNLGLESKTGVISFMRSLQLTGYAFNPVYNDEAVISSYTQDEAVHTLRVRRNDQGKGAYVECKEFSLMNPTDFLRFMRHSQMLGTGLLAWQRIYSATSQTPRDDWRTSDIDNILGNDVFKTDNYWGTTLDQKMLMIGRSGRSQLEKDLATIYVGYMDKLKKGLVQVGLSNFLTYRVDIRTSVGVVEEIREVFPDLYSRMTADGINTVTENMIQIEDTLYPNVISFCRNTATEAVRAIEKRLVAGEQEMASDLGAAWERKSIQDVWSVMKKHKVLMGMDKLSPTEKKERLMRMVERYKSIGWI